MHGDEIDRVTVEQREALAEYHETMEAMRVRWERYRPSESSDTLYTREAVSAYHDVGRCIELVRFDLQPADRIDLARGIRQCRELRRQVKRLLLKTSVPCLKLIEMRLSMYVVDSAAQEIESRLHSFDDAIATDPAEPA